MHPNPPLMKRRIPNETVILQSHYHTPGPAVLAAFPVVLRAGHLRAAAGYAIERRSSPGHDLLFCVAGAGSVRVKGRLFPVAKGELVWINGYEPHAHWADAADPWELLWMRMDGPGLEALRSLLGADEDPVFKFHHAAEVQTCFQKILRRMAGAALHREENAYEVVAQLVAILRRSRKTSSGLGRRTIPKQMEAVINRMALYPHQPWSAAEMARLAGLSLAQFYRSFRQITGSPPIDWLRRERISLAKRRLIESEDPIKTVADQAGYNSPYFFSRDFKRSTGQSPSEFRKQERASGLHRTRPVTNPAKKI